MPEVSIIIPTFNRSSLLKKTLESILDQTYTDYEVIVVSNGSTDDSEAVVKKFKDRRIKFIFQKGSGSPASPRNHGIRVSKGNYIAFCDDDDIWVPEKLEKQMSFLSKNPSFGLCCTKMKRFNEKKEWVNHDEEGSALITSKNLLYKNTVPLSSVVIKKALLKENEWFDETKKIAGAEDFELILRVSKKTQLFCIDDYLIRYYSGDGRFSNYTSPSIIRKNLKYITRLFYVYKLVWGKGYFYFTELLLPFFRNFLHTVKTILFLFKCKLYNFLKKYL